MSDNVLDVIWSRQETDFFCGPAVAQMYLGYAIKTSGSTSPVPTQNAIWDYIKANTPSTRPKDAPITNPMYPNQLCDNCGQDVQTGQTIWSCWSTSPAALRTVIGAFAPNQYGVGERYPLTFEEGVDLLMKALDGNPKLPAIATKNAINHWVVVNGYRRDDLSTPEIPAVPVGSYSLNGVYILDPGEIDAVARVRLVSTADWQSQYGIISCDTYAGRYPTVIPTHLVAKRPWWILMVAILIFLVAAWYLAYYAR